MINATQFADERMARDLPQRSGGMLLGRDGYFFADVDRRMGLPVLEWTTVPRVERIPSVQPTCS